MNHSGKKLVAADLNVSYSDIIRFVTEIAWIPSSTHGLDNMKRISKRLGNPEKKFRSIHIAGTNGKGSVSLKIAKAMEYSNFRCGLFTSPHIYSFRERIKIGSECISEEDATNLLWEIRQIAEKEKIALTYFEYCTLLAFHYFAQKKVDFAVIEVGLGGRLDATNIIHPLASVITSISKDHTELLGHCEEQIAAEKAGIIKYSTPVIIGPRTPASVFHSKAKVLQAPLTQVKGEAEHYGIENQLIAKSAISLLQTHFSLSPEAALKALQIEPPCRFEIVENETLACVHLVTKGTVILDVAHNPDGVLHLIQRLQATYPTKNFHFGFNFSATKDIASCVSLLLTVAKSVFILAVEHSRLLTGEELNERLKHLEITLTIDNPKHAFQTFLPSMTTDDILIICGSFFVMGEVRAQLGYANS